MAPKAKVCVVGAGIIGISTACALLEHSSVDITIIAEEFSPNLTSDIAAGLIEPFLCEDNAEKTNRWFGMTMDYIRKHMKENPGHAAEQSGYLFTNENTSTPPWSHLVDHFQRLTDEEIRRKHSLPQKAGFFYTTLYLEPTEHIRFLTEKFTKNGGKIIKRSLNSLNEVLDDFDIVVNCAALGARKLVDDSNMRPIRGQVMRVRAPGVKHFFIDDEFYLLLNDNIVVLGGTKQLDNWDTTIDKTTANRIFEGNCRNVPAVKNATILSHHVGLRPQRHSIRVESEIVENDKEKKLIVHNYGHGGSGVSLFWGCANDVVSIVNQHLQKSRL